MNKIIEIAGNIDINKLEVKAKEVCERDGKGWELLTQSQKDEYTCELFLLTILQSAL